MRDERKEVCLRVLTVKAGGLFDAAEARTEVCKKVVVKQTTEMMQKETGGCKNADSKQSQCI